MVRGELGGIPESRGMLSARLHNQLACEGVEVENTWEEQEDERAAILAPWLGPDPALPAALELRAPSRRCRALAQ